jgi:23S rRNA (cytosine1962-C5)-methyltransferase
VIPFDPQKLPLPSSQTLALRITAKAEQEIRKGSPWLFQESIVKQNHGGTAGDRAVLFDQKNRFFALGFYDPFLPIRVRILQVGESVVLDQVWWEKRFEQAQARRALLEQKESGTTAYRCIHGENDGFPGLILDRYGEYFVLKLYSALWFPHLLDFLKLLKKYYPASRVLLRFNRSVPQHETFGLAEGMILQGEAWEGSILFHENHLRFSADLQKGHKTGFFLDQRENRAKVESYALHKKVLNVFAYTGGFSLYSARGGAREVWSLDISKPALQQALQNFQLNQQIPQVRACTHHLLEGDAFEHLSHFIQKQERFDLIIMDPPAFAKKKSEVPKALSAYRYLMQQGIALLKPQGQLVFASCSRPVLKETLKELLQEVAGKQQRQIKSLEETGHALDHPICFSDGAYLKCLYASFGG